MMHACSDKKLPLPDTEGALSQEIIEAALEVHLVLGGPGLLETIYESALSHELALRGFQSQRQVPISVFYKSQEVRDPLFLDLLVENVVIVEIKANGKDYPMYRAQLSTYLRLTDKKTGLLLNFGKANLQEGITHVVNHHL